METPRIVLLLSGLAAAVLLVFSALVAWASPVDEMLLAVSALVGSFLAMITLIARGFMASPPEADVPAAIVSQLLVGTATAGQLVAEPAGRSPWRPNLVAIFGIGGLVLVVVGVALVLNDSRIELLMAYVAVFGAYITGAMGTAKDLVAPDPAPSVPAPVVNLLITRLHPDPRPQTGS